MSLKSTVLVNDLRVRFGTLTPEDISRSRRVESASFRLDHVKAAFDEIDHLQSKVEQLTADCAAWEASHERKATAGAQEQVSVERQQGFATGVVYALSRLVEMYGQTGMVREILRESGVDASMAAEDDVAFLRQEIPGLAKGRE